MTGNAPSFAKLLLRIFLPFAFAYFLSYIFRGVNAVIFPYLERDIGITAGDLGLLTSAFFLFFAGCMPVLGVALDRYGPRRVQIVLLAIAAFGSALFGLARSLPELVLARGLIGLGFAGGLMAAICLATSMLTFAIVPERATSGRKGTLREQFRVTRIILTDGFYWRIQPLVSIQQLAFIGCITLWIGPWLRDVGGIADKVARADIQLYTTAVMTLGFACSGVIPRVLRRSGISEFAWVGIASLLFTLVCGWLAFLPPIHPLLPWVLFGFLGACVIQYMPVIAAAFPPDYAGRVTTSCNLVTFAVIFAGQWGIGKVVDLWPKTAAGYAPNGYTWAFGAMFILQMLGLAWLLLSRGRPMERGTLAAAN